MNVLATFFSSLFPYLPLESHFYIPFLVGDTASSSAPVLWGSCLNEAYQAPGVLPSRDKPSLVPCRVGRGMWLLHLPPWYTCRAGSPADTLLPNLSLSQGLLSPGNTVSIVTGCRGTEVSVFFFYPLLKSQICVQSLLHWGGEVETGLITGLSVSWNVTLDKVEKNTRHEIP